MREQHRGGSQGPGQSNAKTNKALRINIVTMGCSKNLVDSEVLLNQLELNNVEVAHDSEEKGFDAVFVNTCGFIHDAKQESIDMILDFAEMKKRGEIGKLYVMGCLSGRYKKELEQEIPEVDRYFGKFSLKAILDELNMTFRSEYIYERKITTPSHYSYLKISEGCNRSCAFCSIPLMTGKYKSRTLDSLLQESRYLAGKGVKEILLIAQDLSYYGRDIYGESRLVELTGLISGIPGIEWIRLHYLYPSEFPGEIIKVIRENPKVCRYIDLPLQHISDHILRRMRRKITGKETKSLIKRIREEVPGICIRTTLMTGFPGESEADFEALKRFVKDMKFDRLGMFTYSHEEGTYAAKKYTDDIPLEIKQSRAEQIMDIQRQISAELNSRKSGKTMKVIIDRKENKHYIGRTEFDSPEVDGEVIINSSLELKTGEFYNVRITGSGDYDLTGEITE